MADDLVDHFFEADHFMERCLKFKHDKQAITAPCKMYKDMQKKAKQLDISFIFIKFSISPSATYFVSPDHPDNFQPEMPTTSQ
jgi:hypothetical protein